MKGYSALPTRISEMETPHFLPDFWKWRIHTPCQTFRNGESTLPARLSEMETPHSLPDFQKWRLLLIDPALCIILFIFRINSVEKQFLTICLHITRWNVCDKSDCGGISYKRKRNEINEFSYCSHCDCLHQNNYYLWE